MNKPWLLPLLAASFALASLPSHALQVVEARDGVAVEVMISLMEPTSIRIENAPITDVFGNIHSSNCGQPAAAAGTAAASATAPVDLSTSRRGPLGPAAMSSASPSRT